MRNSTKLLSALALSVVGASMANADAEANGLGYASATYYTSSPGLYVTASSGQYYSYYLSSTGGNWYSVDYYAGATTNGQWSEAYGYNATEPVASVLTDLATWNFSTFTNEGSTSATLYVEAYTMGLASSYASSWNDVGSGVGFSEVYDTNGSFLQESYAVAETFGMGLGGDVAYAGNLPGGGFSSTTPSSNSFPYTSMAYADESDLWAIQLAPGQSDTIFTYGYESHDVASTTPGPAAIAPFGIGLIGALRRRKRA